MSSPNREFKCRICGNISTECSDYDVSVCRQCELLQDDVNKSDIAEPIPWSDLD